MASPQLENGFFQIANEIAEAMSKINLSAYESRVVWYLLRKTYGWGKKTDWISLSQFESEIDLDRRLVYRALTELAAKGMVIKNKTEGRVTYGYQKDYDTWIKSAPKKSHHKREESVQEFNNDLPAGGSPVVIEGDDEVSSKGMMAVIKGDDTQEPIKTEEDNKNQEIDTQGAEVLSSKGMTEIDHPAVFEEDTGLSSKGMTDLKISKESQGDEKIGSDDLSSKGMTNREEKEKGPAVIEGDDEVSSKGMTAVIEGDDEVSSKGIPTKETITKYTPTKETITKHNEGEFSLSSPEDPPKDPKPKKQKSSKRDDEFILPGWIPVDVWDAYMEVRGRKKASSKPVALNAIVKKLISFQEHGDDPIEVLMQSANSGWSDVYRLKDNGGNGNGRQKDQQYRPKSDGTPWKQPTVY